MTYDMLESAFREMMFEGFVGGIIFSAVCYLLYQYHTRTSKNDKS